MAEITEKIIEINTRVEGEKSVKDLKDQVAELTRLMDTLDKESLEYHRTVDMLVEAEENLTKVMKVGKSQLSAQEGSYNALVNRMAALKKAHKAVSDEASRSRLSDEINKINDQLKEMDAKNGVYVRNVGNYETAVKKALKTPQQELKALRTQLAQLTEGTAEYNAVFTRMAQLTHDVTEQQEQLKWSSADLGDILGNVAGVATSIAGGFSAFNALSGLMGGESEELEKAMLQAQRFIQLIQGLEQLEQLGDKIKGLWKGIENFVSSTVVGTASLIDFNQEIAQAQATSTGAAAAINANSLATNTGAEANANLANATRELTQAEVENLSLNERRLIVDQERLDRIQNLIQETSNEIETLRQLQIAEGRLNEEDEDRLRRSLARQETLKNSETSLKNKIQIYQRELEVERQNTAATQANTAATNAQSAANVTAAATTGLFSKALGVLKTALISTGIGAIIVALGALLDLLGKGLGKLWDWISGTAKAKEQTEALKTAFDDLNESLEVQEKAWSRQEMLMDAQGKNYEEIYEARRKNLSAQLAETRALLASQKAIADDIGERRLQKKKYDEFRETLDELIEKEKELAEAVDDLDYKNYIDDIKERKKQEEAAAAAAKKAAEERAAAYKKEKESAEKLYNDLIEFFKDEKTKLKEKYEEEKKLLEKFGKDTTNLTRKYEQDKTAIVLKEAEQRRKLTNQFNKDFENSFRNPSIEYFKNQIENAADKLADFKDVNDSIVRNEDGTPAYVENWAEKVKYLNETYDLNIQSMQHFDLIMKRVVIDYEDATKALDDYQKQMAKEKSDAKVAEIEKQSEAIRSLMDYQSELKMTEYDLYASQATWYDATTNNYISQMYNRWKVEDSIFQLRKARLQEEIDLYKKAAEDETLTQEARLEALAKATTLERELEMETADYTIAANQRKSEAADNYVVTVQDSLDAIGSILDNVASAWETSIQAQVDAGEISEEEGERQMENMRGIQSAIALINSFSAAVSAYNSMASIPYVGPALGAAAAAAALASGIAQVVAINKVKKGDKAGGDSTRYAEVTPQLPDYNPTSVTNVTGGQETENLANALGNTNLWVSVKDIDSAQSKVKTRDRETSF